MRRLGSARPPHEWSSRARVALLVGTVASSLVLLLQPVAVALFLLSDRPPPFEYLFLAMLGAVALWAVTTVPLLIAYLADTRTNPLIEGELRKIWLVLHLVLANLAMLVYWFLYLRPAVVAARTRAAQSPAA